MSRRYHINPHTGVPSICRAEVGNCPYGGLSGSENHFGTYSEAQQRSQEIFEQTYSILPKSGEEELEMYMEEIDKIKRLNNYEVQELSEGEHFEVTKKIRFSDDEDLVMAVIEGEVYEEANSWDYISSALQNPNISKNFLNDALFHYPHEFDNKTRRWLALNMSLSHDDLVKIIENENEDETLRAVAVRNPNLDKDYVSNIIKNNPERLETLPYAMVLYTPHSTPETEQLKMETLIIRTKQDKGISDAKSIAVKFVPWDIKNKAKMEKGSK